MKKIVTNIMLFIILILIGTNVQASSKVSANIRGTTNELRAKEEVVITLQLNEYQDIQTGINAYKATIEYDNNVFEELTENNFKAVNGWSELKYNNSTKEFVSIKKAGSKVAEDIVQITLKVKANASAQTAMIKIKDITASEGKEDLKIGETNFLIDIINEGNKLGATKPSESNGFGQSEDLLPGKVPQTGDTHIVFAILTGICGLFAFIFATKARIYGRRINRRGKLLIVILFTTAISIHFVNAAVSDFRTKGELNSDEQIDYADVNLLETYLIHLDSLSEDKLINADINNDGYITVTDLSLLIQKIEKSINYEVEIKDIQVSNCYPHKGEEIRLSINANVSNDAKIQKIKIGDLEYPVSIENGIYVVVFKVPEISGVYEINISQVTLDVNKTIKINYKKSIDILKEMPSIENYALEEDINNEKIYISFDLVDPDNSVKGVSATIRDENEEIVYERNLENSNRIEVDVEEGKKYKLIIDLMYNLNSEEYSDYSEYSGIISIEKEFEFNIDYNFSISNIKVYEDTNETSVFEKEDEITIKFNSTNATKFEPQKVKINGEEYTVEKQGEQYIVKIKNNFDIGENKIEIEEVLLSNGKRLQIEKDNEISIETIKRKPTVMNFTTFEDIDNNTMNVDFSLVDQDKTLESLDIILLDDQNQEVSRQSLTEAELTQNDISKALDTKITSKYTAQFFAGYVQKEEIIEDVIFEKDITAVTQIDITKGTSDKTYYEKEEDVVITYTISTNKKEPISKICVNNTYYSVTSLKNGDYKINTIAQNTSGVEDFIVSKVIFSDKVEVETNYTTRIEVLKDIPISEDFMQIDDIENKAVTLAANIIDSDDAFISGVAELYIRNDDDTLGKLIATKPLSKGYFEFTINEEDGLEIGTKYILVAKMTYDRDTDTMQEEKQNYVEDKEFSRRHIQLIEDYNLQITNLNTFNKEKKTHYFEKGEHVTLSFDSTNDTEFYPIKATINGVQYDLQRNKDNYKADILLDSTSGVRNIVVEKITLNNTIQLELKDEIQTNIEILKDIPSIHNFNYIENDNSTVTVNFTVVAEEDCIKSGSVIITDKNGKQLETQELEYGENEITFHKDNSEYYNIRIIASYDLDTNYFEDNANLHSSQVLLNTPISIGDRFLEMKNILGITLYEQKENSVEKVSSLNIEDLNDLDKYIVQVNMKDDRDFYTTIKSYDIENEQLKFVLDYDKVVQYNGNSKSNQLEVVYGSVDSKIATNIDVETLLKLIEKDPTGNYKVNMDFDAKNITSGKAIIPQDFTGTIDFQGHTIKNMSIPLFNNLNNATVENLVILDSSVRANGLFANNISNSTVRNVHLRNVTVVAPNASGTGAFAGQIKEGSKLENVSATGVNIGNDKRTGGLVGMMYASNIKNSYIEGTVNSTNDAAGGVVGEAFNNSVIENLYADITTNYSWKSGSIGGLIGNPSSITLINCISLAQAVTDEHGSKVYGSYGGSKISGQSKGVYELSTSNMTPNEGKQGVEEVTPETLKTREFYIETLGWSEEDWDFSKVDLGDYPTLKVYNTTENAKAESERVDEDIYIPGFSRIRELSNYNDEHKIAYYNMYKLMPFYDAKYYVEDGNRLEVDHILNTKIIKEIFVYDTNGKQVVGLSNKEKDKIKSIRIVFTDDETISYDVSFKDNVDRISIYHINEINIDYMYDKYLVDTNSEVYTYIVNKVKELDYVNDIASITPEIEVRNYIENYPHVQENAEKFALNLLANIEEYNISSANAILEQKIIQELSTNKTMEKLLYAYNYFDRFYNIEIGGINMTDIVYFDGSIFSDKLNPLSVSLTLVDSASGDERGTIDDKLPAYFNKYIKPLTNNLSVGPFLEYFMKNLTIEKYKNDPGSWIVDNYEGTVYEAPAERYKEIRYRVWDHLKARELLILPILSYHGDDLYVLGIPTCVMVGNLDSKYYLNNGFKKSEFSNVTKEERVNFLKSFADKATKFYDSIAGIVYTTKGYANMKDRTMINYDSTSNKNWSQEEDVKPVYKRFFEVLNKYTVHGAASAYANGTDIYWTYDALAFYSIYTHEAVHNQDGNTFLEGTGRRDGANAEYFTDGFLTQSPGTYGIVPNYTYDFSLDQDIATNLTTGRINTREKIEDYYSKMFDILAALDYIEAQAFLQLNPEEQSKVAYIIEETKVDQGNASSNLNIKYVRKTAKEFEEMNLEDIGDLWDNKIVITRNGTSLIGSTDWYIVHNDFGLVNKDRFILIAYQMLADFGYEGYTAYAGFTYKTDLEALRAASGKYNITWREYQLGRYEKIAQKLENSSYFDKDELIEEVKTRMRNDISNDLQNSISSSVAMLRQTIYGHIKRITNDFGTDIFESDVEKIHIKTAKEFRDLIEEKPYGEFVLDKDIDVSDITDGKGVIRETFYGTLDGNGYKITGNTIPLFNKLNYAYITNLNIEGTNISATDIDCGALAKVAVNSNITDITAKDINISATVNEIGALIGSASRTYMNNVHVTSANISGAGRVGTLVGYGTYMTVDKCSSNGDVTATGNAVGGFFGQFDNSSVKDSYSLGSIKGKLDIGGFIGWSEGTTIIKNCYSRVNVSAIDRSGGGFIGQIKDKGRIENCISLGNGTNSYKFDGRSNSNMFNNYKNNYELEEAIGNSTLNKTGIDFNGKIGVIRIKDLTEDFYKETLNFDKNIWDFSKVSTGGLPKLQSDLDTNEIEGIMERIKISSVDEFVAINENPSGLYLLTDDLDFADYNGKNGSVIYNTFTGGIYGDGHTIKNLNDSSLFLHFRGRAQDLIIKDFTNIKPQNSSSGDNVAAFAQNSSSATLNNIKFENITLEGNHRVATVVGFDDSNSTFENISVINANIKGSGVYISTFIGRKYGGSIKNVYVEGTIECTTTENGGLVGAIQQGGVIENVVTNVAITKTRNTYTSNINNSEFNGSMIGNIYNKPQISNCIAFGNMTGFTDDSGVEKIPYKFTGALKDTIIDCLNKCYEVKEETGTTSVTEDTEGHLDTVSENELNKNFYKNVLGFDEKIWNLDNMEQNRYPSLRHKLLEN